MMDFSSSSLHIFSDFSLFFSLFFLSLALTAVVCVANALLMLMSPLYTVHLHHSKCLLSWERSFSVVVNHGLNMEQRV